jgi:meso-butanediol dehydrogenase/(S,S)-butanediol dehydrogenase/diacetyl reductase
MRQGSGAIVAISSATGTAGERRRSAYCAAKSGVDNFDPGHGLGATEPMASGANCLAPGLIDTPLIRDGRSAAARTRLPCW